MSFFVINLLLALLWAALHQFRPLDMVTGFVIGYGLILILQDWLAEGARRYIRRVPAFVGFVFYYLWSLFRSTFDVALAVFHDQSTLKPGIIALPLDAKTDLEIVLLNNLLSLTPGTLGVSLSSDRSTLYVHVINVTDPDAVRQNIKQGLERRLLGALR